VRITRPRHRHDWVYGRSLIMHPRVFPHVVERVARKLWGVYEERLKTMRALVAMLMVGAKDLSPTRATGEGHSNVREEVIGALQDASTEFDDLADMAVELLYLRLTPPDIRALYQALEDATSAAAKLHHNSAHPGRIRELDHRVCTATTDLALGLERKPEKAIWPDRGMLQRLLQAFLCAAGQGMPHRTSPAYFASTRPYNIKRDAKTFKRLLHDLSIQPEVFLSTSYNCGLLKATPKANLLFNAKGWPWRERWARGRPANGRAPKNACRPYNVLLFARRLHDDTRLREGAALNQ
jgi:hypothetical protein